MKPKHVVRLPITYPAWQEGPYGSGGIGRHNLSVGSDNKPDTLDEVLVRGAKMARQLTEWIAEEDHTIRQIYHPDTKVGDHLDIYERPKKYFGKYVMTQSVRINWIEQNLMDSEAEIPDA